MVWASFFYMLSPSTVSVVWPRRNARQMGRGDDERVFHIYTPSTTVRLARGHSSFMTVSQAKQSASDSPSDFSELITQMRAYQRPYKVTRQAAASNTLYIVKRKIKPWKLNWKLEKMASLHLPDSRGRPAAIKFNYAIQPARAQSISKLAAQQQSQQNTLHCWSNWKNKHAPSA